MPETEAQFTKLQLRANT